MRLVIILSAALCALGIVENFLHQRNLRKIPIRILVNGTRGKSSVTRLIAGALREAGYRTIAKTTGSDARIIIEDGTEIPVPRPLGPRIIEQKALARLAARHRANALVVECMAIRPESQMVMQRQLVRATIGVITNVRVDHVEEMGPTLDETALALSFSIPREGILVTSDSRFAGEARRVVVVDSSRIGAEILSGFSYPVFAENLSLALQVAAELGISRETALRGMINAQPDIGVLRVFKVESPLFKTVFINGFAANDVKSTILVWEQVSVMVPADLPMIMLYNNRMDREYRIAEFLRLPQRIKKPCLVAVVGEHQGKVAKLFSQQGLETVAFTRGTTSEELLTALSARVGAAFLLFGVGNIYGMGKDLAAYCAEHGSAIDRRREGECFRNR